MIPSLARTSPRAPPSHQKVENYNSTRCLEAGEEPEYLVDNNNVPTLWNLVSNKILCRTPQRKIFSESCSEQNQGLRAEFSPPGPLLRGPDTSQRTRDSWGQSDSHRSKPPCIALCILCQECSLFINDCFNKWFHFNGKSKMKWKSTALWPASTVWTGRL